MMKLLICSGICFLLCAVILGFSCSQTAFNGGKMIVIPVARTSQPEDHHAVPGGSHSADDLGSLSGIVRKSSGEPIRNARVFIRGDDLAEPRYVFTNQNGEYSFEEIPIGDEYLVIVRANPYIFATESQTATVNGRKTEINFTAEPQR